LSEILKKILASKTIEVEKNKKQRSLKSLEDDKDVFQINSFEKSLSKTSREKKPGVIAEIKKASPSKGVLKNNFNPTKIALSYECAGAACISVLTDNVFFGGSINDLLDVRKNSGIPVLRKDFVIDPYQIFEARAYGADCILLIAAALDLSQIIEFEAIAKNLGMDVLIEVHNKQELEIALSCKSNLIGINNRDLNTFKVDIENSYRLSRMLPESKIIVSESGISSFENMQSLMNSGVYCFLIGETLMKHEDPGEALSCLLKNFSQ
jgi:indole-3-glycerol phosphate synthase